MRYVGRHRTPRPLYLRRPVVGGVVAAVLVGGPALAVTVPRPDATLNGAGASPSSTVAQTLIPTDDALPTSTGSATGSATRAPSAPATAAATTSPVIVVTSTSRRPDGTVVTVTTTTRPPQPTPPPGAPLSLVGAFAGSGTVGERYLGGAVRATGGTSPYTYSAAGVPPGLRFADGALTGTPTSAGSFRLVATVRDATGATRDYSTTITIAPAPTPVVGSLTLPAEVASGGSVSAQASGSGGVGGYTYTWTTPAWLSASGASATGTAPDVTEDTDYTVTVRVSDGRTSDEVTRTITVTAPTAAEG